VRRALLVARFRPQFDGDEPVSSQHDLSAHLRTTRQQAGGPKKESPGHDSNDEEDEDQPDKGA
jgi:hypothetical protein